MIGGRLLVLVVVVDLTWQEEIPARWGKKKDWQIVW